MSDIATLDQELNQMVLNGKAMEAFEKFYADDVVMQENSNEPCVGKDANRTREEEFFASLEEPLVFSNRSTGSVVKTC